MDSFNTEEVVDESSAAGDMVLNAATAATRKRSFYRWFLEIPDSKTKPSARERELQQCIMLLKAADGKPQSVAREEQQPATARGTRHFNLAHVDMQARNATDAEAPLELDEGLALGPPPNHVHVQTDTPEDRSKNIIDESMRCSICFSSWEANGPHRLVCLKCGHLFGESCIKSWIKPSLEEVSHRVCALCRKKALLKDIRLLHAQPIRAENRTEEHELRKELEEARCSIQSLSMELDMEEHHHKILHEQLNLELAAATSRNKTLSHILEQLRDNND